MTERWFAAQPVGSSTSGSALMTRVGGRTYPARVVPQCKTCNSPYRTQIENALIKSYGYASIVRSLPEDAGLSERNIMQHFQSGHLPLDESVRRVVIEQDAKERGLDIEGHETTLANHVTLAKLGVQKVLQRMMAGELEPDIKDGIAFATLLTKLEETAGDDFDRAALMQGFIVYMSAIQQVCTPEQVQQVSNLIAANPVMKSLLSASASGTAEVIDVEGIEA